MQIKKEWTAFDVVTGMFTFISQKHGDTIPDRRGGMHSALFEIAKKREYAAFLGEYVFDFKGTCPRADSFDADLNNMVMSGLIAFSYSDYSGYVVLPEAKAAFEGNIRNKFSGHEISMVERMADEFYEAIRAKTPTKVA